MIFSSYLLLVFLPLTLMFFALGRHSASLGWTLGLLTLASLVFYGAWDWRDVFLLLASIALNYMVGLRVAMTGSKVWLAVAVVGNLAVLVYYKYAALLFGFMEGAAQWKHALPLGISFFTFTQIAWQVDLYRRRISGTGSFAKYGFFVVFFPHLIAGPIVHARDILPQVGSRWLFRPVLWKLGLSLFCMGLMKKVLLADSIAPGVDGLFTAAAGQTLGTGGVLMASTAYGVQLYFDFSGYADMAIGLGLLFGIRLPTNFRAPYRSASIIEFWRRWHITLSHFLRDYLYRPLGGGRGSGSRRSLNLMLTMLLGGLWHGAGWQFVLWGGGHGLLLVVNHAWRRVSPWRLPRLPAQVLTLLVVMLAWVAFRADSLTSALTMYKELFVWRPLVLTEFGVALTEVARLDVRAALPWVLPPLLMLAAYGPTALRLCLRLNHQLRGMVVGAGLLLVLKTLAERPDRAFLYFNF